MGALLSDVAVGDVVTATIENAQSDVINLLQQVVPAISGTGTVSVNTAGEVTAVGSTQVACDNAFPDVTNYHISIVITGGSGTITSIGFNFRSAGATDGTAVYDAQSVQGVGTATPTTIQGLAQSSWQLQAAAGGACQKLEMDIFAPNQAIPKIGTLISTYTPNPMTAAAATAQKTLLYRNSTAFDGFKISVNGGGNINAKIYVTRLS